MVESRVAFSTLILAICFATTGWAQVTVSGRISLCNNFEKNISVQHKLSYTYPKRKKGQRVAPVVDTLQADILTFSGDDSLITKNSSDTKGRFTIIVPNPGTYKIRFSIMKYLYRDTLIDVRKNLSQLNICVSDSGLHNYYLRQIGFDSIRAEHDLLNDTVRIITLISQSARCRISILDMLSHEEKKSIEDQFGFHYQFFSFSEKIPQKYCDQRETEYNSTIFKHLDHKHNGNSAQMINAKILQIIRKRRAQKN
jgi:hypothetical protein